MSNFIKAPDGTIMPSTEFGRRPSDPLLEDVNVETPDYGPLPRTDYSEVLKRNVERILERKGDK